MCGAVTTSLRHHRSTARHQTRDQSSPRLLPRAQEPSLLPGDSGDWTRFPRNFSPEWILFLRSVGRGRRGDGISVRICQQLQPGDQCTEQGISHMCSGLQISLPSRPGPRPVYDEQLRGLELIMSSRSQLLHHPAQPSPAGGGMFINCCLLSPRVQGALGPGAIHRGNNRISSMSPWIHSTQPPPCAGQ